MKSNANLSIPGTNARLGDKVRDVVTGFEGIASSYSRSLTGCDQVGCQGPAQGDEQKRSFQWIDVMSIEVVESNAVGATPIPRDTPAAG